MAPASSAIPGLKGPLGRRAAAIARLGSERFDLLVVGGGITGSGVALDAASRGLRTALLERDDIGSGTSSRSSKLVHGGVRYLRQGQFGLVHEALTERRRLLRNAPHLVRPLPFLYPVVAAEAGHRSRARMLQAAARVGLTLYDVLGGRKLHPTRRLTVDETVRLMPALDPDRVTGAFLYYDAHADDARLTLAVARTAADRFGATIANHCEVTDIRHEGPVHGVVARDRRTDRELHVEARVVVNATGVWADEVRRLDEGSHPGMIRPAKGVHFTIPRDRLPVETAAILGVAGDERVIFVVPWGEHIYVGTTDTDYDGPLDAPRCTEADLRYLLDAVNAVVRDPIGPDDVTGTWAGLRPLIRTDATKTTDQLSRKHAVLVSPSGMVTVTGGKLTTYRQMASDAVDAALGVLDEPTRRRPSRTKRLPLVGAEVPSKLRDPATADRFGVSGDVLRHLVDRYGGLATEVLELLRADPSLSAPLIDGLPYVRAEARYAVEAEWALDLLDVLSRRTRALLLDADATADAADDVAELIGPALEWDRAERRRQIEALRDEAARAQEAARDPHAALWSAAGA